MSRKGTVLSNATKERMAEVRRRWWASKRKAKKLALKRGLVLEAAAATTTKATTATTRGKKKEEQVQELDALSSDDDDEDLDSDDDEDEEDDDFSLDPSSSLDLERAVAELSSLRAEVSAWISAFAAASGGRTPTRADAERSPQVYRKFIRFIALQDFVRSARGGGGGRGNGRRRRETVKKRRPLSFFFYKTRTVKPKTQNVQNVFKIFSLSHPNSFAVASARVGGPSPSLRPWARRRRSSSPAAAPTP